MSQKTIDEVYDRNFDFVVARVIENIIPDVIADVTMADGKPTSDEIIDVIRHLRPLYWNTLRGEILDALVANRIAHWLTTTNGNKTRMTMPDKSQRLRDLEEQINRASDQITNALRVIRDEQIYEVDHETFEEYCVHGYHLGEKIGRYRMMPIEMPST